MKELFENMDNWTLIKILGGLTIVLSSIISFFAYFIKDYYIDKWKFNYQIEIEKLKTQLNQNNIILNNLTNSISNIYLSSNEKRIEYLDKVWNGMMVIKQNIPSLIYIAYNILSKEEIIDLPNTKNKYIRKDIDEFEPEKYFVNNNNIINEIEKTRPFIGEKLWIIFFVYQAFIGRLTFLIQDGLNKGKVEYWIDDDSFFKKMLGNIIKPNELVQLLDNQFSAYNNIINFLEYKALNDISEQITGKKMTEESLKRAIELSKMTIKH